MRRTHSKKCRGKSLWGLLDCCCGGGGEESSPAQVTPQQSAADVAAAQIASFPAAAQAYWNVESNPTYGAEARTGLYESIRRRIFPNETAARDQAIQNIIGSLISPTGYTPAQQAAIDTRRGQATSELQRALRERANLGGGLYGGRAAQTEGKAVGDLQNQFAEQDVGNQERARLNALNALVPYLQILYPQTQLQGANFINPVASGDTALNAGVTQRGQDMTYQAQQEANRNALYSSMFNAVGNAAGGWMGGAGFNNMLTP